MRTLTVCILILLLSAVSLCYDYEIHSGYTPGLTLLEYETLWMTGGGVGLLNLDFRSEALIEGTSHLSEGQGGIWQVNLGGYSNLEFMDGEIYELDLNSYATATLRGGRIDEIWTYQGVGYPYINLYCRSWDYNSTTKMLTGLWNADNNNDSQWDPFNIQLVDVQGYVPTFDNINIIVIPEPASLALLVFGSLLIRKKS